MPAISFSTSKAASDPITPAAAPITPVSEQLGTVPGAGGAGKVRPAALEQFRVFVQSTSYNRVLVAGTGFLYEVDADH